jgi:hypothetical protein
LDVTDLLEEGDGISLPLILLEEESGREAGKTGSDDGDLDGTLSVVERLTWWWRLLSHCVFVAMTLLFWMKGADILPSAKWRQLFRFLDQGSEHLGMG